MAIDSAGQRSSGNGPLMNNGRRRQGSFASAAKRQARAGAALNLCRGNRLIELEQYFYLPAQRFQSPGQGCSCLLQQKPICDGGVMDTFGKAADDA